MGQRVFSCPNLEHAKGFLDGLDFGNDSALTVTGCKMNKKGTFSIFVEDTDYIGCEQVFFSEPPTDIDLDLLRQT